MILKYPIRIYLEVTDRCNFKCVHCYLGDRNMSRQRDIPFSVFTKIVREMEEIGIFELILGGGEPLIHPLISHMLQYLSNRKLFPAITTNGYFVDTAFIQTLESIKFKGSIQVSIHGNKETHNRIVGHPQGYDHAMGALQKLLTHGFNTSAAITPTRQNYKEIPQLLEDLEKMGITSFNIIFVLPVGRATRTLVLNPDEHKKLRECIQRLKTRCTVFTDYNLWFESAPLKGNPLFPYYCTCGVAHATIDPDGNVFPCSLLKFPQFKFGNCTLKPLKEIFDNPERDTIRKIYGVSPPECKGCAFEHVCKGGCRAVAFAHHKKLLARDIRCPKEVDS